MIKINLKINYHQGLVDYLLDDGYKLDPNPNSILYIKFDGQYAIVIVIDEISETFDIDIFGLDHEDDEPIYYQENARIMNWREELDIVQEKRLKQIKRQTMNMLYKITGKKTNNITGESIEFNVKEWSGIWANVYLNIGLSEEDYGSGLINKQHEISQLIAMKIGQGLRIMSLDREGFKHSARSKFDAMPYPDDPVEQLSYKHRAIFTTILELEDIWNRIDKFTQLIENSKGFHINYLGYNAI